MGIVLENSPLNEVVMGIQFENPIETMDMFRIIDLFRGDFPIISEQSLLPSVIESTNQPQIKRLLNSFSSRKHLISQNSDLLIQVQPDRFLLNWRRVEHNNMYPRFKNIYDHFDIAFNKVKSVLGHDVEEKINQLELTYVNHVLLEAFQQNQYNPSNIFNFFDSNGVVKSISLDFSIPYDEINGVWNLLLKSANRRVDEKKVLVYEATCRGITNTSISDWFSDAHKIHLSKFEEYLTPKAREIWKLKEE